MAEAQDRPLLEAPALRDQVYTRLRDAILSGEIAPGERVSPGSIAKRWGTSTMPVREALRLLEDEGLVEAAARRWTRVVELDPSIVLEVVPLVTLLEEYAVKTAREPFDRALERMRAANADFDKAIEAHDLPGIVNADSAFHDALVELAGNRTLERALRDAKSRIRLLRGKVLPDPTRARESHAEHERIIEALADNDRNRAARLVRQNWDRGLERFRAEESVA